MPKYLISADYTAEGLKGLQKDKASGRRRAISAAMESLGGKLEAIYFALGEDDIYLIADLPDNAAAARYGIAVSGLGSVHTKTVALFTPEEIDAMLAKKVNYRAPGE
jgi:uncharacterized protein with GYD domain